MFVGITKTGGAYEIECIVPENSEIGQNQVVAHAMVNEQYAESWTDPVIEIYSDTILEFDMTDSVGKGGSLFIRGYLKDISEKTIPNQDIKIYWNGEYIATAKTNALGIFYTYYPVSEIGSNNIYAKFDGTTYLSESDTSKTIYVKDYDVTISLNLDPMIISRKNSISFNGEVKVSDEHLPNSNVNIYYQNDIITTAQTNAQGNYSGSFIISENSYLGFVQIIAESPETESYAEARAYEHIEVYSTTKLVINSPDLEKIKRNSTITISGTIKDDNDNAISNAKINIDISTGKQMNNISTNDLGEFSTNYKFSNSAVLGSAYLNAKFDGEYYYLPSEDTINFEIVDENYNENDEESQNTYILLLIAAIIISIVVGVILLFKKQKSEQGPSVQDIAKTTIRKLQNENDYRASVINCYKQMCDWLTRNGIKKGSFHTPREFAMIAKNYIKIKPESLYNLTQIFEKARYSKHEIGIQDRDNAIKYLNEILSAQINLPTQQPGNVANPDQSYNPVRQ
jgi:hypothetical protein